MSSNDPLLQPYQLKHLTLKNRVMSTSHEPAYSEDGMPKERYRLYHAEKAKGGMALTMTAGSAIVARDSPAAFGNLQAYRDEIVPWMKELTEACHEHDCKVMIQLTHLGRRTGWNRADWLPVLSASPRYASRPIVRSRRRRRIGTSSASSPTTLAAAQRMASAGLDGIEFEAYGHLMDGFWSPATSLQDGNQMEARWKTGCASPGKSSTQFAKRLALTSSSASGWSPTRIFPPGLSKDEGVEIAKEVGAVRKIRFPQHHPRPISRRMPLLTEVIPIAGMRSAPHLDFAGEVKAATKFPVFHAARIADIATARHAIAGGKA